MKKLSVTLISALLVNFIYAQNPLVKMWDKDFGGDTIEYLKTMQQTYDGGYILGGYSYSGNSGDKTQPNWDTVSVSADYWIVKIDSAGNKQWDKTYGGTVNDVLFCLQQTRDGGFIIGGYSSSDSSGDKTQDIWGQTDYWIVKTDSVGNKQWDKDFGGTDYDIQTSLKQTSDGGYILAGYSYSGVNGDKTQPNWDSTNLSYDYWIIKIDSLGNKEWDRDLGGTADDWLTDIKQTLDGGYILGGYTWSGNIGGDKSQPGWGWADYWIIKLDSVGNKQWDKRFGGTFEDRLCSLEQTTDRGYILGGFSYSNAGGDKTQSLCGSNYSDYWMVKIDSLGNMQWDKAFGGTLLEDEFSSITKTDDGGYLLGGSSYSPANCDKTQFNLGWEQSWIVKTDSLGNQIWDKTILTGGHDEAGVAIQTRDGCFAIANYTYGGVAGNKSQPTQGYFDYWIIKFCDSTKLIPASNFLCSDTSLCNSGCINFIDISTNNPSVWQWNFPGATPDTSTNQNPSLICYQDTGQYTVTLITSNSYGSDTIVYSNLITVYPNPPIPIISVNGDTVSSSCLFNNQWYLNGNIISGATQDTFVIQQSGWYIVSCTDSNICFNFSDSVYISPVNILNFNLNSKFSIYPNPFFNGLNLKINNNELSEIILYDITSRELLCQQFRNSVFLNTEQLAKGIYLYEVRNKNGVIKKGKVVKE